MKKMFKIIIPVICAVLILTAIVLVIVFHQDIFGNGIYNRNENSYGEINPDTWTATDGLGRTLPTAMETGEKKKDQQIYPFFSPLFP